MDNATTTLVLLEEPEHLTLTWDGPLITASYLLSAQSCYTAILILQMKFTKFTIVIGSFCLSVCGIWGMHFTGMAAMQINTSVDLNIGWTIASAIFAFACTTIAFLIVDAKMVTEGGSIEEDISVEAHIKAIVNAPNGWIVFCAALIAAGVCSMHYVGMHALETPAEIRMDSGIITASCLIALFDAYAALNFAFVLPITKKYTIPTALVAAVAVCGMHYSGMYGIKYYLPRSQWTESTNVIKERAVEIVFGCLSLSFISLAYSTHLYKLKLREAAINATVIAQHIIDGNYEVLTELGEVEKDPVMRAIQEAYLAMGTQLQLLKSFLPQSLLAQFEGEGTEGDTDEDAQGSEKKSGRNPSINRDNVSKRSSLMSRKGRQSLIHNSAGEPVGVLAEKGVTHRKVSVLAFNVRGFNNTIRSPALMIELQRTMLESLFTNVSVQKGIVDSFQGDHAICTFNAAKTAPGHSLKAASATMTFLKSISNPDEVTIGISSGMCVVGVMGTKGMKRSNVVGPAFTQAVVLERLCKQDDTTRNLLPYSCFEDIEHHMTATPVDVLRLPGAKLPCMLLTLTGLKAAADNSEWMYELEASTAPSHLLDVYTLYAQGQDEDALRMALSLDVLRHSARVMTMVRTPLEEHTTDSQGKFYRLSVLKKYDAALKDNVA
ncbi:Adenylate cyclase [Diplonema papillatum]|nr:Adenylate cyclase [Diplonema papillatum]